MTAPAARWSDRQRAMLDAMGLRLWSPADAAPVPAAGATAAPAAAARTVPAASGAAGRPAGVPPRASPGSAPGASEGSPVAAFGPPARRPAAAASTTAVSASATAASATTATATATASDAAATAAAGVRASASTDAAARPPRPVPPQRPPRAGAPAAAPDDDALPPAAAAPAAVPIVTTVPGDVASMDWAALERTVAGCVACPLAARRTHTVFGAGGHGAHWMIVGEAPGEQEDLSGEPFVGASGRLLDRMLAALGLARDAAEPGRQVYIANTVKCRPPRNRNPEPAELAACEAYLARQIALVRPRVILALGRVAAHWLLRTDEPLGRLRGRPHRYEGVPLVVTYHPAYLLRQAEDKARAWDDLCLAREVVAREGAGAAAAAAAD